MKNIILTGLFFIISVTSQALVVGVEDLLYQLNEQNRTAIVCGRQDRSYSDIDIPDVIKYRNIQYAVVGIRKKAFKGDSLLTTVCLGNGPSGRVPYTIDDSAFVSCTKLQGVYISADSLKLGNAAFSGCRCLQNIVFSNWSFLSVGNNAFMNCISLTLMHLPQECRYIGKCAFMNCISLASMHLPQECRYIGKCAFMNCISLASIYFLPRCKVNYIGRYAFKDCISLDSITIPEGITKIEYAMFEGCKNLKRITIPSSLKNIEDFAFWGCTSLDTLKVHNIDQWCQVDKGNIYSNPLCYSHGAYLYQNDSCKIESLVQSVTIRSPIVKSRSFFKISNLTVTLDTTVYTVEEKSFFECPNIHLIYQGETPVNAVFRCENATYN